MRRLAKFLMLVVFIAALAVPAAAYGGPAYHEGFEHDTGDWITDETPGQAGWCGDIEQFRFGSGPVLPSKGLGYAVVEHGPCNAFWTERGWPDGSGPYAPFGSYSESWPKAGFTTELDVYLDPNWSAGTSFIYAVSFDYLPATPPPSPYRYVTVPVEQKDGELWVADETVGKAGWYTFRHRFMNKGGRLAIDFELARRGHVLFKQQLTTTAFTGEEISSFDVNNVGTGYVWFVSISDGLRLPIDEQLLVPVGWAPPFPWGGLRDK